MDSHTVLVVEKNIVQLQQLTEQLQARAYTVIATRDQATALQIRQQKKLALIIICAIGCTTEESFDTIRQFRAADPVIPVILITRQSSEASAIAALKLGVNDYYKWPVNYEELLHGINGMVKILANRPESRGKQFRRLQTDHVLVGNSPVMRRILAFIPKVGHTDSTVLITGETGTGKECVARQIHSQSHRDKYPLACINCAALPDSLLESELFGFERGAFTGANTAYSGKLMLADGGSVFFDEIGDMSQYTQAKVLRVFENNEITPLRADKNTRIDIRIIAATNRDLKQLVVEKKFREDLFYRINVTTIHIPPLRDRREDIPLLIEHFLQRLRKNSEVRPLRFTYEALQILSQYAWPGNVRELKNMLESLSVSQTSDDVKPRDLPDLVQQSAGLAVHPSNEKESEKELLISTLSSTNWNKSETAKKLHWSRMTVYRKMQKYHIDTKKKAHNIHVAI